MSSTTIQIDKKLKKRLEDMKIYPRETYGQVISRMMFSENPKKTDRENLIETVEVLSDPNLMRGIKEALVEKGGIPLEDFERELGL